nr:hypothetical protein [Phyllobacterium zundukense]
MIDYRDEFDEALATEPVRPTSPREDLKPLIPAKSVVVETGKPISKEGTDDDKDIIDAEVVQFEPPAKAREHPVAKPAQTGDNERIASVLPPFPEKSVESKKKDEELVFPVPDDPGVRPEDEAERSNKKFRLF